MLLTPGIILCPVKYSNELSPIFHKSWKNFSSAWKKAQAKASEKSIHDLRVDTRRLIATLELVQVLCKCDEVRKLRRHLKKVLKSMRSLRDVQVQLENASQIPQLGLIAAFSRSLECRERREIERLRDKLKRGRRQQLTKAVEDVRSEFDRLNGSLSPSRIHRSVAHVLTLRRNEFLRAERRFQRLRPLNEGALHEMRIALKKLRYVVEAAQPVLGPSAKQQADKMHAFQQLMGDSHDVDMLRVELEKWARKKGRIIAVVPTLEQLKEKREDLLRKIIESSDELEQIFKPETPKPIMETTYDPLATVRTGPFQTVHSQSQGVITGTTTKGY
jgi:CHAD domain-containing protein